MSKEKERAFKGVWISKEIYLADDLSWSEKILLIEIDSLDNDKEKGCFASNAHFAEFLGLKENSIANMVSRLKQKGYLRQVFFDGRNRGLRTSFANLSARKFKSEPSQKSESCSHKKVKQTSQKSETEPSQKSEHNNTYKEFNNTERENAPASADAPEPETESDNPTPDNLPSPPLNSERQSLPRRPLTVDEAADLLDAPMSSESERPRSWQTEQAQIYFKHFPNALPTDAGVDEINRAVKDKTVFDTVCKNWKIDGNRAKNISGILDKYEKEVSRQKQPVIENGFIQHSKEPPSKWFH